MRCVRPVREAICQVELMPLFEMSQPALAKHLKILDSAGVIGNERRGLWVHYFIVPDRLRDLAAVLGATRTAGQRTGLDAAVVAARLMRPGRAQLVARS